MVEIPEQIRDYSLIRVCRPDCMVSSHGDCSDAGKRPVSSVENIQPLRDIRRWVRNGGNYGVVPQSDDDLVIIDSDSQQFSALVQQELPDTFTVQSGGGGRHFYFKVPSFSKNSDWTDPKGSVRSDNYHAVGPGSNHQSGGTYRVLNSVSITEIPYDQMDFFCRLIDSFEPGGENVQSGGRGAGSAHFTVPDSLEFIRRDDYRKDVAEILKTHDIEHSRRLWMVGFLYSACGLRKSEIVDLIMQEANWSKLDRETTEQQVQSAIRSSNSKRGTHYSEFSPGDMAASTAESRKTEESGEGRTLEGGDANMVDFNDKLETTILEGSEEGESFKKIVLVEGDDNGETFEYLALKKGNVQEANTTDGEAVLVENVTDSVSLGSPEYLDELIEGLQAMKEQLDG